MKTLASNDNYAFLLNRKNMVTLVINNGSQVGFIEKKPDGWVFKPKNQTSTRPFPTEEACKDYVRNCWKDAGKAGERETKPNTSLLTLK